MAFIVCIYLLWKFFKGRENFKTNGIVLMLKSLLAISGLAVKVLLVLSARSFLFSFDMSQNTGEI